MPARSIVTARHQRLGAELRKLRERAGLTAREAAKAAGIAESKISMTEAGRVGVSMQRVRYLARQYACDDAALVESLVAMATDRVHGWWEEYRGLLPPQFLDLAELEYHSTHLTSFENMNIPGLLQTQEHVRALYDDSVWGMTEEQREARIQFRLRRQEILNRDDLLCEVVIHEAALRIRRANRKVARGQLLRILEQSERPQVTVRVVPFDVDGFRIGGAVLILGGPVPQLDTVLLESPHGAIYLDAEAQLARYRRVIVEAQKSALGIVESREFIHHLAQHM